ncbi:metal ABC transporter substrate-binding protein [Leekyejoonella antrihumi]|nr:metal ABC transporter substrate-binding protein [Leekyejoonella antrihumi]
MTFPRAAAAVACAAAIAVPTLAACGGSAGAGEPHTVSVAASFYPMAYAVQQIGGDHVTVTSLTPNGAEPHDIELTPKEVLAVSQADLVVYAKGFQASVDKAVQTEAPKKALNVATAANLDLSLDSVDQVAGQPLNQSDTHGTDPHFWLDPTRYAKVARDIAARLESVDPTHKAAYAAGLKTFTSRLTALDRSYTATLKTCRIKDIVTSHAAFGYLAQHYGMTEVGVSGIAPDQMPTPGRLQAVSNFVTAHHVTTIYSETLASPAVAQTIARQTGTKVKVLDPIEGITDTSAGKDYFAIMRANLATLKSSQECN